MSVFYPLTFADLVAAFATPAPTIELTVSIDVGSYPVSTSTDLVTIRSTGAGMLTGSGDVLRLTGNNCSLLNTQIVAAGRGVVAQGIGHSFIGNRINSTGDGLTVQGNGPCIRGNRMNGQGAAGSRAFKFDGNDTIWFDHNLAENYDTGVRVGADGSVANMYDDHNLFDKCSTAGWHIEPGSGFRVGQYFWGPNWGSGNGKATDYPMLINGNVEMWLSGVGYFSFTRKALVIAGSAIVHNCGTQVFV